MRFDEESLFYYLYGCKSAAPYRYKKSDRDFYRLDCNEALVLALFMKGRSIVHEILEWTEEFSGDKDWKLSEAKQNVHILSHCTEAEAEKILLDAFREKMPPIESSSMDLLKECIQKKIFKNLKCVNVDGVSKEHGSFSDFLKYELYRVLSPSPIEYWKKNRFRNKSIPEAKIETTRKIFRIQDPFREKSFLSHQEIVEFLEYNKDKFVKDKHDSPYVILRRNIYKFRDGAWKICRTSTIED